MMWRTFGHVGVYSFGGPAAQISLMHKELVDRRGWLSEQDFLSALSFCMVLPGPEAMQLATYAGWKLRGTMGAVLAGLLFVLPGASVIAALALAYAAWGDVPLIKALFLGVKAAVVVIVLQALLKIGRRALTGRAHVVIALLAFVAIYAFNVPFPAILAGAAAWGALTATQGGTVPPAPARPRTLRTVAIWGGLWAAPLVPLVLLGQEFLLSLSLFFAKLAVVTFGGAYAVLGYLAQTVVQDHGWITAPEMIDALGLAETTPGPLILVTQFTAMLAGHHQGGLALALIAGALSLWMTFVPCFLWVLAGAPYLQNLMARPRRSGAFAAITAAVVGVIVNLTLWFAMHVWFAAMTPVAKGPFHVLLPQIDSLQPVALGLSGLSAFLLLRLKWGIGPTLGTVAACGLIASAVLST